ncbi:MAG TPA: hypothetical protein VMV60_09885 [Thermoanaerobaculia bacterium]|nr:hypothetical protein [Thermoanaerobaculia bacterium]
MKRPGTALVVAGLTLAVLAISVPGALREARAHGVFYLFSTRFFEDLPKRLLGPGRFRFILQPATALFIGWRAGRADARAGRPPYLRGLLFHAEHRAAMARETAEGIAVLLLMGILLDSVAQWAILGISYPGAALVIGPVLITLPYTAARSLAGNVRKEG